MFVKMVSAAINLHSNAHRISSDCTNILILYVDESLGRIKTSKNETMVRTPCAKSLRKRPSCLE